MEISIKALWMGATLMITVALISIGIFEYKSAKRLSNGVNGRIRELAELSDLSELMRLDGITVSGADIYLYGKKYLNDQKDGFSIYVDNGVSTVVLETINDLDRIKSSEKATYVNPAGKYISAVELNGNKEIEALYFTKI